MLGMLLERQGRVKEAEPFLIRARQLPEGSEDWAIASGVLVNAYFANTDVENSLPILEELVVHCPQDDDAWYKLGICLMTSNPTRARDCFLKCLELVPAHSGAREQLANLAPPEAAAPLDLAQKMAHHQQEVQRLTNLLQTGKISAEEFAAGIQAAGSLLS